MRLAPAFICAVLVGCGGSQKASSDAEAADAGTFPREVAAGAISLPRGFYVSQDTPCGEASNATLGLLRRTGWNGSQYSCDFASIEQTGEASFRVTEQCTDNRSGDEWTGTRDWVLTGAESVSFTMDDGQQAGFRHCPQASLPEPWRDSDISDIIAE